MVVLLSVDVPASECPSDSFAAGAFAFSGGAGAGVRLQQIINHLEYDTTNQIFK